MLASGYDAAELHALPSWYELPGLVSIEAAARGLPCVVSDNGTIRDYLGDYGFYCAPEDPSSIRKSIEEALKIGKRHLPKPDLSRFTWENSAKRLLEIYEKAISLPLTQVDPSILNSEKLLDSQELNEILQENPNLANLIKTIR
jgi:glycosyltransferase involved in cell wall biosynthesis